jgi:CO dehydrogenase nickel-insertion accessory protein CooC1
MNTQAQTLAPPEAGPAGRLIAIASGKGGVGKTWLSVTLAHALSRAGKRVLLFDGDLGLANVDVQLGLAPGRDVAPLLGCSHEQVRRVCLPFDDPDWRRPSEKLKQKVAAWTGGAVSASDWLERERVST